MVHLGMVFGVLWRELGPDARLVLPMFNVFVRDACQYRTRSYAEDAKLFGYYFLETVQMPRLEP
jgi:hypothetical protein